MKREFLKELREGKELTAREQLLLTAQLSVPAIMAQVSSIVMQYIDASMVGRLGAEDSAAIGLVASTTWLLGGIGSAASVGFTVQIAQAIGAGREEKARNLVRQGLAVIFLLSALLTAAAASLSGVLPAWLGGEPAVCAGASSYFLIYALSLPAVHMNNISGGMLQCSGNMRVPSILHILMCVLDVVFNSLLIFPARTVVLAGVRVTIPGAAMGVAGAALGTALAQLVCVLLMLYFLLVRSPALHLVRTERLRFSGQELFRALRIALPVGFGQVIMSGAQIMSTRIVAPLGSVSIAANSFAVTAESLCYMPGYGIGTAATTLIGQSIGAGRKDLTRRLGWLTTGLGMAVMTGTGALLYLFAPFMIGILSPDPQIRQLGCEVLRIEAFAEPMFAASIVASGVFRGAGDTFVPSLMDFVSMWAVRLPLAAFLAPRFGLHGVWTAMCLELMVRGALFLVRLAGKRWQPREDGSQIRRARI